MKTVIISLGGSIIVPKEIDTGFIKNLHNAILEFIHKGNKAIIFCGGGGVNRKYVTAAKEIVDVKDIDLDLIGIMATRLNAEFMRSLFSEKANSCVVYDPTKELSFEEGKSLIFAAGWVPGWSTDCDAVKLALNVGAQTIINLSNIAYVYDKDPKKYPDAKPLETISWDAFRKIVGDVWSPRLSMPFDPIASKEAAENKLKVIIADGTDIENTKNILYGMPFKGTTIE